MSTVVVTRHFSAFTSVHRIDATCCKLSKKSFDGFNCESKFNLNFEDNAIQTITPIEYKCFSPQ